MKKSITIIIVLVPLISCRNENIINEDINGKWIKIESCMFSSYSGVDNSSRCIKVDYREIIEFNTNNFVIHSLNDSVIFEGNYELSSIIIDKYKYTTITFDNKNYDVYLKFGDLHLQWGNPDLVIRDRFNRVK